MKIRLALTFDTGMYCTYFSPYFYESPKVLKAQNLGSGRTLMYCIE
jgi:hypothetical protein